MSNALECYVGKLVYDIGCGFVAVYVRSRVRVSDLCFGNIKCTFASAWINQLARDVNVNIDNNCTGETNGPDELAA